MNTDIVSIYPDMTAFLGMQQDKFYREDCSVEFYGASSLAECVQYTLRGATQAEQAPAVALMEKIDAETHGREINVWTPSVVGAFPNVPEYLQGMPDHMRARVKQEDSRAPIRLVCETLVSGGVNQRQLEQRGAAMAALAMRLSETRPVELWAAWAAKPSDSRYNTIGRVQLDVSPVSLAQCVAVMGSRQFMRGVIFVETRRLTDGSPDRGTQWAWGESPDTKGRTERLREALMLEPEDIFIPGGYFDDREDFIRDPVAWVNKYLEPQRNIT